MDINSKQQQEVDQLDQVLFQLIFAQCIQIKDWYLFFERFGMIESEIANTSKQYIIENSAMLQIYGSEPKRQGVWHKIEGIQR